MNKVKLFMATEYGILGAKHFEVNNMSMTVKDLLKAFDFGQRDRLNVYVIQPVYDERKFMVEEKVIYHDLTWKLIKNASVHDDIANLEVYSFSIGYNTILIKVK